MSRVSQPWPGLALAMLLSTGCDDLFNLERVNFAYQDAAPDVPAAPNAIVQIAAGGRTSCVRTASGEVLCWGMALTTLASEDSRRPRLVASGVRGLSVGDGGVCITMPDRTANCWGENNQGELGVGVVGNVTSPMPLLNDDGLPANDIESVAIGNRLGCALRTDGSVTCAGDAGLLGNGTTSANPRHGNPVSVIVTATAISAGDRFACAIRTGGQVWCWGDNAGFPLGVDGPVDGTLPLQIEIDSARAIATGDEFACAIREANDAMMCWGRNSSYQTGDGTQTDHGDPTVVTGQLSDGVRGIAAGSVSAYFVRSDGTAAAWGLNQFGQLGIGTLDTETVPTSLSLTDVAEISSNSALHVCARTTGDRVFCWGDNVYGQVGDGTKNVAMSPIEVTGLP